MVSKKAVARMGTSYKFSRTKKGKRFNQLRPKKNIHFFKRTYLMTLPITNAAWQTPSLNVRGSYNNHILTDLPNATDFTAMYDQYKICGIKYKFIFEKNEAIAGSGSSEIIPTLVTVNDYNTEVALADENTALQYASCKQTRLDKVTSRYFKPASDITELASGQGNNTKKGQWLNTSTVRGHHGMLVGISTSGTGTTPVGNLKAYITFYVACRSPR